MKDTGLCQQNPTHKIVHSSAMHYQNLNVIHEPNKKLLTMKSVKKKNTLSRCAVSECGLQGSVEWGLTFSLPQACRCVVNQCGLEGLVLWAWGFYKKTISPDSSCCRIFLVWSSSAFSCLVCSSFRLNLRLSTSCSWSAAMVTRQAQQKKQENFNINKETTMSWNMPMYISSNGELFRISCRLCKPALCMLI